MPKWLLSRRHFSSRMSGRAAIKSIHRRKSWLRLALVAVLGGLLSGDSIWWDRRVPRSAIEIFEGVTYGSARLEITPEGGGLLHWLRIDLSAPGIELYVTPLDRSKRAPSGSPGLPNTGEGLMIEHHQKSIHHPRDRCVSILPRHDDPGGVEHHIHPGYLRSLNAKAASSAATGGAGIRGISSRPRRCVSSEPDEPAMVLDRRTANRCCCLLLPP